jgi:hypothetical protein
VRSLGGDRVEAATTVRATTRQAPKAQPGAASGAVLSNGFGGELRAGRDEPAWRQPARTDRLIEADNEEQRSGGQAHLAPGLLARCIASVTRLLSS